MNYLGIDWGEKKIGLAISAGDFARPFLVLRMKEHGLGVEEIKKICSEEDVGKIVIGFPGQDRNSPVAKKITGFKGKLEKEIDLPIFFQDETLSSKEALQKMIEAGKGQKKRRQEDGFAAAIILQEYLDELRE